MSQGGYSIHQLLIFAARAGNEPLVSERIAAGGDLNFFDEQHGTALFAAIRQGHRNVVRLLLSKGASPAVCDFLGYGALEYALQFQDDEITELVLNSGVRLQPGSTNSYRVLLEEFFKRRAPSKDL